MCLKKEVLYDLTSLEPALESLSKLINVSVFKVKLLVIKNKDNIDNLINKLIRGFDLNINNIDISNLYLKILHVTTSNDNCESIKKFGLLNLQNAIKEENTSLSAYLKRKGIKVNLEKESIEYDGNVFTKDTCEKNMKICFTKFFNYNHYPINGFIYGDDPTNYGGEIKYRPEIIGNLAKGLRNIGIEQDWKNEFKCYTIVFKAHVYDLYFDTYTTLDLYEEDRDFEIKKWLLEYSVKLIHDLFYYRSSSDKYAFMNKEFEVTQKNIIDCIKN